MRIASGLHRVGSDLVAVYLVEEGGRVTVIDAGLPGLWSELLAELEVMGRSLDDVAAVLLTHGDTDHLGFAERLRREAGVPVLVHEDDAERARTAKNDPNGAAGPVRIRPLLSFLWYSGRRGGLRIPGVQEVRTFRGGDVLDVPGSPRVVHLPGHTDGSVAFHVLAVDAVVVGDAMTTRNVLTGITGPQPAPFTLEPARALDSLSALAVVDASWVLPGHGPPWGGGTAEAVAAPRRPAEVRASRGGRSAAAAA